MVIVKKFSATEMTLYYLFYSSGFVSYCCRIASCFGRGKAVKLLLLVSILNKYITENQRREKYTNYEETVGPEALSIFTC